MTPAILRDTIQECWQTAEDHGFHSVKRTFGDACILITTEIVEAFESYRKNGRVVKYYFTPEGKPEGTGVELADAVIRIFDVAVEECVLSAAQFAQTILTKMDYNKSRPYLHGKSM